MAGNRYPLEVRPIVPEPLARLHELANNLIYSWDRRVRGLFRRIDAALWDRCDHNPVVFLRRVDQAQLDALAEDSDFLSEYQSVLAAFDHYLAVTEPAAHAVHGLDPATDQVAYLCMEYGLHESMALYSGGLGILAGDHCKAAADLGLPFIAVGLMFRQGYFSQTVDAEGQQHAHYQPVELADQPISAAHDADGRALRVRAPIAGREVHVAVWQAVIGHVRLLLLDTELDANTAEDRRITYQLYGGDASTRIAQELVLGVGGVRALRALGMAPSVWHLNEGHPAFSVLERCRERVAAGHDFDTALEAVAAATVFTTHTPVPAGHDFFAFDLMGEALPDWAEALGIDHERLLALGVSPDREEQFNMTALAVRGSRRHNGVSRVHAATAARMEHYHWPDVPPADNPIASVTNGIHVPTFLARDWADLFDGALPGWRGRLSDEAFWREGIEAIPNQRYGAVRQLLKSHLFTCLQRRLTQEYSRRHLSRARIRSMRQALAPDNTRPLVIGFARRFATYKRALLLFHDPARLARLLGDPERPVIVLFAGKAHPQDEPGQALIRELVQRCAEPAFRDRVFFIEGYDITLARHLVTGVDVWLNTPEYPMEASGTSGQKAAANGAVNLSVLDGWWAEGFDGSNGWAIEPHGGDIDPAEREAVEAEELLDRLEDEVIPSWFAGDGHPPDEWIARSKASMASILPRFNAQRMLGDYAQRFYQPAAAQGAALDPAAPRRGDRDPHATDARALADWKQRMRAHWPALTLTWAEPPPQATATGESLRLAVEVQLGGLSVADLRVECVFEAIGDDGEAGAEATRVERFTPVGDSEDGQLYALEPATLPNGLLHYRVRAYPCHDQLAHAFEMGLMASL
jgi:starch phosphorylase